MARTRITGATEVAALIRTALNRAAMTGAISLAFAMSLAESTPADGGGGGGPSVYCVFPFTLDVCDCVDTAGLSEGFPPYEECDGKICFPRWISQRATIPSCAQSGFTSMVATGTRSCMFYVADGCDDDGCWFTDPPDVVRHMTTYGFDANSAPCTNPQQPCLDPPPCPPVF